MKRAVLSVKCPVALARRPDPTGILEMVASSRSLGHHEDQLDLLVEYHSLDEVDGGGVGDLAWCLAAG